jgi:four helix bundle protein
VTLTPAACHLTSSSLIVRPLAIWRLGLKLEDLEIYQLSMDIGEKVWRIVERWDYLSKKTIGTQLIKAADSIAANISEGFGRFHYKEAKQFSYYARGSLFETKTWLTKSNKRNLLKQSEYEQIVKKIDALGVKLNNYINSIGRNNK